jgi:hypothetical protein
MNTTLKSLITAGGTITAAAMFYLLRHFPGATPKRTQPESSRIEVPLGETPPCESPAPAPTPPRSRLIPRPAVEPAGLTAKTLLDALALMRSLIQRHPTLPIVECVLLPPLAVAAYTPRPVVFIVPSLSPWAVAFVCVSQLGVLTGATLVTKLRGHPILLWPTLTLALLLSLTVCGCLWASPVHGPNILPRVWDI